MSRHRYHQIPSFLWHENAKCYLYLRTNIDYIKSLSIFSLTHKLQNLLEDIKNSINFEYIEVEYLIDYTGEPANQAI